MTNVYFYHLPDSMGSLFPVLVNLVEMALEKDIDTLILCSDQAQATPLHNYIEQRFQLGERISAAEKPTARFSLCWADDAGDHHGMFINLTNRLPSWFSRFEYLAELIAGDDAFVERKREIYRLCRHRGYPLQYHDLTSQQPQRALI